MTIKRIKNLIPFEIIWPGINVECQPGTIEYNKSELNKKRIMLYGKMIKHKIAKVKNDNLVLIIKLNFYFFVVLFFVRSLYKILNYNNNDKD